MKVYKSRKSQDYIDNLKSLFDYNNIRQNSLTLRNPKNLKGIIYDKFIRIDFIGIAASTLLDGSNFLDSTNVYKEFKNILFKSEELHSQGVFIKVRFLLEYEFSVSSYSRIQAESSYLRASMTEPSYSREFELIEELDQEGFNSSFSVNLQKSNLRNLQNIERELYKNYNWNSKDNPSSITLKFTPVNPTLCGLFINNKLFYDPYLFAKQHREDNKLSLMAPVVEIDATDPEDADTFEAFEDHFRYFWELDVTLDCEDATFYQRDKLNTLAILRTPQSVDFEKKAQRICAIKGVCDDDKAITSWKKQVNNKFNKFCSDLSPTIANETIFITCSWSRDEDGISSPNEYAQLLNKYLIEDFSGSHPPIFSVHIMQATPSEFLSNQLYQSLDNTTVGIILMTKDIESSNGSNYCRPNVYHELGYLMKQLGKRRLLILKEEGVVSPSNIQDIIRFDFEVKKMTFRYHELISQLNNISNIPKSTLINALENHIARLNGFLKEGEIVFREFKALETKINQQISKYR